MGVILNRRRVCGGKDEGLYIQDGLVFWLDGINKGDDTTAWTDLVNGIVFPYNSGQEIRSDSVYFKGSAGLTSSSLSLNHPGQNCQIEVVIDNNVGIVIIPLRRANIAFGFNSGSIIIGGADYQLVYYKVGGFPQQKTSYSMNTNHLFYDDVVLNSFGGDYWSIDSLNVYNIGHRNSGNRYTGNIYSIRIYDRHLTDEERIHNYNIDKQRFGL